MKIECDQFKHLMGKSFESHELKNCSLVVDAQNFFYGSYEKSELPYVFGCECDRYAEYLKQYLSMFKKANVKCFFVFKGGHKDMQSRIDKESRVYNKSAEFFSPEPNSKNTIPPVFMKETYKQVLDEMGFPHVTCEFEAKDQCIALAQKLNCAVMSNDKEFYFSTVPYIRSILKPENQTISCQIFRLETFYRKYGITYETFVIYIVLMNKCLPESSLKRFFRNNLNKTDLKTPLCESLLIWLSNKTKDEAVKKIFCSPFLHTDERKIFLKAVKEIGAQIQRQEPAGVPVHYILNCDTTVSRLDPMWFEKGVASQYIAVQYINLYHWNILCGSWAIEDSEAGDAMTLSLDIIKYAYNLLTNFQKHKFCLHSVNGREKDVLVARARPLVCPNDQRDSVFQNGWSHLNGANLFECFLVETFGRVPKMAIDQLPEDAKVLMISLAYFWRMKEGSVMNEVYCIILSYIMLGVVQTCDEKGTIDSLKSGKELTLDILINKTNFTTDCHNAKVSMRDYFTLSHSEMVEIFDRKLLHPFVEFQHCLDHMNFLNRLCGTPYRPTVYRKTYNGTFVFKMFYDLREDAADGISFLKGKMQTSPSIFVYFESLIVLYKQML